MEYLNCCIYLCKDITIYKFINYNLNNLKINYNDIIYMEILDNIRWFISSKPRTATNKITFQPLTDAEFNKIIFDNKKIQEPVKLSLVLNDNYTFFVSRKIQRPVTVEKLLNFIYDFYNEPLESEYATKAFEGCKEWKDAILEYKTDLINFDVFTDNVDPDFCGLEYNKKTKEYIVHIGPE